MSLEWIAAGLGVLTVALVVMRSVWNYPVALVMVTLYIWVFWQAKLYSDAGLQVFFFVANIAGWWAWGRNAAQVGEIAVRRLTPFALAGCAAASLAATLGWGGVMATHTDASYPYWDASIAMLSITGQLLMVWRYLENWWWWIVVNIISIGLYYSKGLIPSVWLYGLLLIMAVLGLIEWQRAERKQAL
jgi:nicotinamide mononucleotide transporter